MTFLKTSIGFGLMYSILFCGLNASTQTNEEIQKKRMEAYTKLTQTLLTVESIYVDKIDFDELVNKSIQGLLTNLDSHSSYMDKKRYKEFTEETNGGEFGGIGISVGSRDKILTIIAPIEDTPGQKVGLKSGDKIVKIDGVSCIEDTLEEAVKKMRGVAGTKIVLTVVRDGEVKPLDFEIIREIIKVKSVKTKLIKDTNIVYIKITNFDKNVSDIIRTELKKYQKIDGLVLDLRNNPGGLLDQAIEVTDLFVDDGVILEQKGRTDDQNETFKATKNGTYSTSIPLVVLVNEGSASASEIVTGALQDKKRAVVVGKQTFGKGSVQAVIPLSKEEAMKVTIARYYLPSGRTIQAIGLTPDIEAVDGEVIKSDKNNLEIKEADLKNHLTIKEYVKKEKSNKKTEENIVYIEKEDVLKDNQLNSGLNALKAIMILRGN